MSVNFLLSVSGHRDQGLPGRSTEAEAQTCIGKDYRSESSWGLEYGAKELELDFVDSGRR